MKTNEQKTEYPLKDGAKYKVAFAGLYVAAPALLTAAACLCFSGMISDVPLGRLPFAASFFLWLAIGAVGLAGAVYLFFCGFRYGTFSGYFAAQNSRRFKYETLALLAGIHDKSKYSVKSDVLDELDYCLQKLAAYKKFYLVKIAQEKLEAVVYNETLRLDALASAESYGQEFSAAVKKVRFCVDERFTDKRVKSYKGGGDYTFISYAHRNAKTVLPAIQRFQEAGLNIWFDEGITEGDDWMNHIAEKIDGCSRFVMFQSAAYAKSANCNVEIKRALKGGKTIIRAVLEDCELQKGLEMYLDAIQAVDCRTGLENKLDRIIDLLTDQTPQAPDAPAKP